MGVMMDYVLLGPEHGLFVSVVLHCECCGSCVVCRCHGRPTGVIDAMVQPGCLSILDYAGNTAA
jgi:hypothetical protein